MKFAEIKTDFENMRNDLEQFVCSIELIGGMKTRGCSAHDVDVKVVIPSEQVFEQIRPLFRRYNKVFYDKYDLYLHVIIELNGEFFEQYYGLFDVIRETRKRLMQGGDLSKIKVPHG